MPDEEDEKSEEDQDQKEKEKKPHGIKKLIAPPSGARKLNNIPNTNQPKEDVEKANEVEEVEDLIQF